MRRIAVCADDFGHGPQVDAAILQLVAMGRLDAVGCQVAAAAFAADAAALAARGGQVDLGLHLDLAPGRAELRKLLVRTALRAVEAAAVRVEIEGQLEAFERAIGRPPDFVDGHQHVHQLAVVRDVLLELLASRYGSVPPVRNTVPLRYRGAKPFAVAALGGVALRRALIRRGVRHNADLVGVYDLAPGADYRALARRWLGDAADGALWMCHPGLDPADPGDPIGAARAAEHAYLSSPEFPADCAAAGVRRARLTSLA